MTRTIWLRLPRRIIASAISFLGAWLLLVGSPVSRGQISSPITVQHILLTPGFDEGTELLFTIVQQNGAATWIVTNPDDPLRYLASLALNTVDYVDSDSFVGRFEEGVGVDYLMVDSELLVHLIEVRRERDGSLTGRGPRLQNSLGDPRVLGQPTSIAVIPRAQDPSDPWVAVGTNSGNVILARSGIQPCVLPVGGPVVDLAIVPQVGYFAFVALLNSREAQHLVGLRAPDGGVSEQIIFDLVAELPPQYSPAEMAHLPPLEHSTPFLEPTPVSLVAANGTRTIYRLTIPASPIIGGSFRIEAIGSVRVPISAVAADSLALLPIDRSGVIYDPLFVINEGGINRPLLTVFGNSLELSPETLRMSSDGQYLTALIESAGGKAADIVLSTLRLEVNGGSLRPASSFIPQLGDADFDRNTDLSVKFNRNAFQARIPRGASSVLATARWTFADGTTGFASSEIRVIE